jgi:hypothetical protein
MSLHVKTQLLEMLYSKALRISGAVKSAMGVGPIVNLQSNDAAKIWAMPSYAHMVGRGVGGGAFGVGGGGGWGGGVRADPHRQPAVQRRRQHMVGAQLRPHQSTGPPAWGCSFSGPGWVCSGCALHRRQ